MADSPSIRLRQLHGRLGDLVYQFTKVQFSQTPVPEKWAPPVNVFRCPKGFAICLDLAGVDKTLIDLEVQPRLVRIQGRRETPEPRGEDAARLILAMEIDSGPFERQIALPSDIESGEARAEYKDGLLWIYLPFRGHS